MLTEHDACWLVWMLTVWSVLTFFIILSLHLWLKCYAKITQVSVEYCSHVAYVHFDTYTLLLLPLKAL